MCLQRLEPARKFAPRRCRTFAFFQRAIRAPMITSGGTAVLPATLIEREVSVCGVALWNLKSGRDLAMKKKMENDRRWSPPLL